MLKKDLLGAIEFNEKYYLKDPNHDEIKDGYCLNFVGKNYARLAAGLKTTTLITPDEKQNEKYPDSKNIFISGDNLDALKHLEYAYTGMIDMIYIDPPYNTNDDGFGYNDTFKFTDAQLKDKLGLSGDEVKKIRNMEGKCSHSAWLTFMYPRLLIAKRLLKESGAIFISIDENEYANLKIICDEIFRENNFVGAASRKTRGSATTKGDGDLGNLNDILLIYFNNKMNNAAKFNKKIVGKKKYPFEDERGKYYVVPLQDNGPHGTRDARPNLYYPIYQTPDGKLTRIKPKGKHKEFLPSKHQNRDGRWMWGIKKFDAESDDLTIYNSKVHIKHYYNPEEDQNKYERERLWLDKFLNKNGTDAFNELFEKKGLFKNPKPVELVEWCLKLAANKGSLILDFFAGSGTTAQAVMKLNAEDEGNRSWILCTLDEPTTLPSAIEAGYKTIDEICMERIERAAKKYGDTSGFRHFYVKEPETQTLDRIIGFEDAPKLLETDDIVKSLGVNTLLQTYMIDDGFGFDEKVEALDIDGYKCYYLERVGRLYLIEQTGWNSEVLKKFLNMIGKNELSVVDLEVCAYSFDFVSLTELKTNIKNLDQNVNISERY